MREKANAELKESIDRLVQQLRRLASQPCYLLGTLKEDKVPESIGVYVIYEDKSGFVIWVGKATKTERKSSGQPSGLRFRIMRNHLGKAGDDSFLKYLAQEIYGDEKQGKQAAQHVKHHCLCCWLEVDNQREALLLEHFAIAVLDPRLNRGGLPNESLLPLNSPSFSSKMSSQLVRRLTH